MKIDLDVSQKCVSLSANLKLFITRSPIINARQEPTPTHKRASNSAEIHLVINKTSYKVAILP